MISIEEVNNCFLCDRDLAKKTIAEAHSEQIAEKGIYGYAEVYVSNKVKLLNDCDLGNEGDVYDRQEIFYMVMPDKDSSWEVMDHTIEFLVMGAREVSEITFTSVYGGVDKNRTGGKVMYWILTIGALAGLFTIWNGFLC